MNMNKPTIDDRLEGIENSLIELKYQIGGLHDCFLQHKQEIADDYISCKRCKEGATRHEYKKLKDKYKELEEDRDKLKEILINQCAENIGLVSELQELRRKTDNQ